ncbi:hypothetical protein JJV70_12175 [Streptomyces sp. JJ66]|uniref:hypothetical protein n=1 Tax=Streptomyces sp. JJ66 TaxID=2803843 RepID=UPI001C56AF40|nr:hypothetical protein [Streptomyces sp. JJ66]MBW1602852.1 hypothetical protein [Streptomyces sp. JJ66]
MSGDDRPTMPPVRLPDEAELARDALAAPLLSRAAALARWAGDGVRLTVAGDLPEPRLAEAARELGLGDAGEALGETVEAWHAAVDAALVEVTVEEEADGEGFDDLGEEVARTGDAAKLLTQGGPEQVLEIWRDVWEAAVNTAGTPSFEEVMAAAGWPADLDDGAAPDPDTVEPDLDWDPQESADFLDAALANLYLLTAEDPAVADGAMVPLPVLAASMVVPDDMDHPTDAVLEDVSEVMMRLDAQLRVLEPSGGVEYRPVDEALLQEAEPHEGEEPPTALSTASELPEEELSRYGMVRFTPLGLYGERASMLDAGVRAPAVGDLVDADAPALLAAVTAYPEALAQVELEQWLARRPALDAARALLDAARGRDALAPRRRLLCQQGLAAAGAEAEPALREVLDDAELGGLARVWLAEHGAADVPPPGEELIFWLTVDTLAAQLDPDDPAAAAPELSELMAGLVAQHSGFFDKAWRVEHPATPLVLEAMARLHPDRAAAKAARKAAYKARSRTA